MVVKEAIPDLENWDVQIVATDASTEALENARRGLYSVNSMRLVDGERRARYFREHKRGAADARFEISDDIRKMVRFSFFNLMDEDYPGEFDVIFCRNVVIYFELDTTIRVMKKFASSLRDDGYLFIGYSESLQFISEHYRMLDWEDAIYYVKTAGPVERPRPKFLFAPIKGETEAARSREEADKVLTEVSQAEIKAEVKEVDRAEAVRRKRPPKLMELLVEATKAAHQKHYDAALSFAGEAARTDTTAAEPHYITAEIFLNQGRVKDAKENLKTALEKDVMFAPAHYLAGSIHVQEGDHEEAKKSLKKALYLDDGFSIAHLSLANIYRDSGHVVGAIREYRNTLIA
jgi:chemotaxis protein methyltransferase CheR